MPRAKKITAKRPSLSHEESVEMFFNLLASIDTAIKNITDEISKPIDQELSGSQRKAELQAVKQSAMDCSELIRERASIAERIKQLMEDGKMEEDKSFSGGFAESMSQQ